MSDKADFFVSYNKADRGWAEWVAWQLEDAGYTAVIQAWDFRPGQNFVLEMSAGLARAERVLGILSPDYLGSLFTAPEWADAFSRDGTSRTRPLLTVRVRECELPPLLKTIIYVDLVGIADRDEARRVLLAGVSSDKRVKPSTEPAFPGAASTNHGAEPAFPGNAASASAGHADAHVTIHNLPHAPSRHFTGRGELLAQMEEALGGEGVAVLCAHGLGGVGKTQTALAYAHGRLSEYHVVWWVRAEDAATLAGDYAALAGRLGLPEAGAADQESAVEAVRRWLEGNGRWLLVFDNAQKRDDVRRYLPRTGVGHVLVTSRDPAWGGVGKPLSVRPLAVDDAAGFLRERTGDDDADAARDLARELGCLPLALEQAGAYVEETGLPLREYLPLYRERHAELAREQRRPDDYTDTVETTWELSFRRVEESEPAAADLLSLCSFFAPDDIPLWLLRGGVADLPERLAKALSDPLTEGRTVAALRRFSLVDRSDDALSVHRLVQQIVRERLPGDGARQWAEAAARLLDDALPAGPSETAGWPQYQALSQHAVAVATHCFADSVGVQRAYRLLNDVSLYLHHRSELSAAEQYTKQLVKLAEATFGLEHPYLAAAVNNLGGLIQSLGDFPAARAHYEQALRIDEAAYGPDHPTVAIRVSNLGGVLRAMGDLPAARGHYERALHIDETAYGPDHPTVASDVGNLGGVLKALGDLPAARAHCERALRIDEAAYGPDHPTVAIRVNNLGSVLESLGDFKAARAHFERALQIDEAAYGPDHPNVARDVNNLGSVLRALGDLPAARAHYARALQINEAAYGPGHPNVSICVSNLGGVLRALGDLPAARAHFERALQIDEAAYGPDHPRVAIPVNNLGIVLESLGDIPAARAQYERALAILLRFLPEDHPHVKLVSNNLDRVMKKMGETPE